MWSQSIVTPKYLCYKKEKLLRQNIFFITQPRDGNHVALSPNLKALVFPASLDCKSQASKIAIESKIR
jgi:hypothetical protein